MMGVRHGVDARMCVAQRFSWAQFPGSFRENGWSQMTRTKNIYDARHFSLKIRHLV